MARRGAGKAKIVASGGQRNKGAATPASAPGSPPGAAAGSAPGPAPAAEGALLERLAAVERERDALLVALSLEQERHRKLEEVHAAVRDRIAWALDSLQSLLEAKG